MCEFRLSDFFADLVAVSFAAVARNHFADESCKEELESKDYGQKGEVEKRLFCHWSEIETASLLNELLSDYPYCHEAADKKHHQTGESEEVHRLLTECAEEPK